MSHSAEMKQYIYGLYWKTAHLSEQYGSLEFKEFLQIAREKGIFEYPANLTAVHVIDCIGNNEPINNTALAEKMDLTKASITKITTKLLEDDFIERIRLNDNKKEIHFRLTAKAQELYVLHAKLHKEEQDRYFRFLERYTSEELSFIKRFYQDMIDELEERMSERKAID
ncbi:MarR family transcriptional regulator [Paenibacillus agri]|uniref:MarR family transcriptional regulator n=1 Tax=Paenibacillus agri TaxID=2744309 RepID=A0A850EKS7_9BACL|nr:MarR family transcriptional regulator [Paenibacillus agri]NUU60077.1 MarR family transcriptional regulator [Paenibacillus agri]